MKYNIHILSRNTLFALFTLYFAQGIAYATGTLISQISLLLIILISGLYFVKTLLARKNKNRFYWAWTLLLSINVLGFIFTMNFNILYVDMFKSVLVCLLTFYPFYYFSKKNLLPEKYLIAFFIVMLSVNILQFYNTQNIIKSLRNNENVVNNIAYMFVVLIPYVFLIQKRKILSGIILGIIMYFILIANKRGAIITGSVGAILYFYFRFRTIEKNNRFSEYLLTLLVAAALGYFAYTTFQNNEYLIIRMTALAEGDTSNRDIIYNNILNSWFNSDNLAHLLFGYGFAGSLELSGTGNYAHNDWLELLSNFGLIGVFIYAYVFSAAIKTTRNKNWQNDKRIMMFTIIAMWFLTTLFSMWYSSIFNSVQVILIAYLVGHNHLPENNTIKPLKNENPLRYR